MVGGRTRPARPRCISHATRGASGWWCGPTRSRPGCLTTSCERSRPHATWSRFTDTTVVGGGGEGRLQELVLRRSATGDEETVPADGLFVLHRRSPAHRVAAGVDGERRARVPAHRDSSSPTAMTGRSSAGRSGSRRACRACWPPETCDGLGQARGLRGRRGLDRDPARPKADRRRWPGSHAAGRRGRFRGASGPTDRVSRGHGSRGRLRRRPRWWRARGETHAPSRSRLPLAGGAASASSAGAGNARPPDGAPPTGAPGRNAASAARRDRRRRSRPRLAGWCSSYSSARLSS